MSTRSRIGKKPERAGHRLWVWATDLNGDAVRSCVHPEGVLHVLANCYGDAVIWFRGRTPPVPTIHTVEEVVEALESFEP